MRIETWRVSSGWLWRILDEECWVVEKARFPYPTQQAAQNCARLALIAYRSQRALESGRLRVVSTDSN